MKKFLTLWLLLFSVPVSAAEPIFFEAETFSTPTDGWKVAQNSQTRSASRVKTLHGATGDVNSVATKRISIPEAGKYRLWVRYLYHQRWRGAFHVAIIQKGKQLAAKDFDTQPLPQTRDWQYVWDYVDANLPAGELQLELSKTANKNCIGYVRHVDCFLLTSDASLKPNHLEYGPQTFLRISLGDVYKRPVYVHVFADHYHYPWYQHFHLSKAGAHPGLRPNRKEDYLLGGEQTAWCNITPMLYQDSGAALNISIRHTYYEKAVEMVATLEFATAPNEKSVIKTMRADCQPNGLVVIVPPDLTTEENRSRLMRDRDFAIVTGKIADQYDWPTVGKKPKRFPFFVTASVGGYGVSVDQSVFDREWKTLDYFGFCNRKKAYIHGVWYMMNRSYCQPDIEKMKTRAAANAAEFKQSGKSVDDIVYCMLMDEPTGQPSSFVVTDTAYQKAFREWLKKIGKKPADLLVDNWDAVRPVVESQRDQFPGLHYYTQRFRTRALGDFMVTQRVILEKAFGRTLPTLVNFSDGATYAANFYSQGVDYFELLDDDRQNAIWSEDWANGSSSYQCGAYNVDLMRAAARDRQQLIGHYLIAHAGRKPWDIKLKAASETARGVRIWKNFSYGPSWSSHEGGPPWKSHLWYNKPETWKANAELIREIGAYEDLLLSAKPEPAQVAILYSSSSDIWTLKRNHAFGFNRMHNWMALAHAQIPVDFLSERQVKRGQLQDYKVCYLSGPNLTAAAAEQLLRWVQAGGTLYLSAGAASRDEFNRPLSSFNSQLPVAREPLETLQPYHNSGAYVHILQPKDTVTADGITLEVLSVRQKQKPRGSAKVLATFADGTPAIVRARVGRGTIYSAGFLPALDYIKKAIVARRTLQAEATAVAAEELAKNRTSIPAPEVILSEQNVKKPAVETRLDRSRNPWDYPASVRQLVLQPVRTAQVKPALTCSVPLVDAVLLHAEKASIIPVANYTLEPLREVKFSLRTNAPVATIESVHQGRLQFERTQDGGIRFSMPLDSTDYIKIGYK